MARALGPQGVALLVSPVVRSEAGPFQTEMERRGFHVERFGVTVEEGSLSWRRGREEGSEGFMLFLVSHPDNTNIAKFRKLALCAE